MPTLKPRLIEDYRLPDKDDPTELFKNRFLCEGGGMLLGGYTGIGKSSFIAQLAVMSALNRPTLGFVPARPLRWLIVQAENDDGDIAEQREGVLDALGMPIDKFRHESAGVYVCSGEGLVGMQLVSEIRAQMDHLRPNMLVLDPALAFQGGDSSKASDVGRFLRQELQPAIQRGKAGCIINVHMNKPSNEGGRRKELDYYELLYAATGSIEWANWARAIAVVMPDGKEEVGKPRSFRLVVPKRGARLGWVDHGGDIVTTKLLQHSEEGIAWRIRDEVSAPDSAMALANLLPGDGTGLLYSEWMAASKLTKSTFNRQRRLCLAHFLVIEKDLRYRRNGANGAT